MPLHRADRRQSVESLLGPPLPERSAIAWDQPAGNRLERRAGASLPSVAAWAADRDASRRMLDVVHQGLRHQDHQDHLGHDQTRPVRDVVRRRREWVLGPGLSAAPAAPPSPASIRQPSGSTQWVLNPPRFPFRGPPDRSRAAALQSATCPRAHREFRISLPRRSSSPTLSRWRSEPPGSWRPEPGFRRCCGQSPTPSHFAQRRVALGKQRGRLTSFFSTLVDLSLRSSPVSPTASSYQTPKNGSGCRKAVR